MKHNLNSRHVSKASSSLAQPDAQLPCADTGSSHILLRETDAVQLSNVRQGAHIRVSLPNGGTISSTLTGDLQLPNLSAPLTAYVFPDDTLNTSLLSISELCNKGCVATFTSDDVHVTCEGQTVLHHHKDKSDSLWTVQLPNTTTHATASSAILRSDTDEAFATFIHKALGSPVLSTLLRAVRKGYLSAYPRLTASMVTSYLSLTAEDTLINTDEGSIRQR